jgi:hypothetical protein
MPILGTIASSTQQGLSIGGFVSLATVTLGSAAGEISVTGLPSTYKHLLIRARTKYTATYDGIFYNQGGFRVNSAGSLFTYRQIFGKLESSSQSMQIDQQQSASLSFFGLTTTSGGGQENRWSYTEILIPDYAATNKNKTWIIRNGTRTNTEGQFSFVVGSFQSTNAISSIQISGNGVQMTSGSSAMVYGISG